MGSTIKENAARDILINENPDILMIQETKAGNQDTENLKKEFRKYEGEAMKAIGALGGICTISKKGIWELIQKKTYQHWIITDLKKISTRERYRVINIYAPNHYKDKEQCWATLKETLQENQAGKVILGGNLNMIRSIEEKFGGNYQTYPSKNSLEEIMERHSLLDIPPNNGKYT